MLGLRSPEWEFKSFLAVEGDSSCWSHRTNFSLKVQPLSPNLPSETLPTPSLCPNQAEQSELKVQPNVTSLACS